ncbi:hypothetical protein N7510_004790 [Penicillium lagena]|uniref:uncharacterized protein n=1 Tax=Penicillium lagena TaxID=94218 RepID=UPI0025403A0A|nr:uncharacterized protein N7510_004790 [Penicillium lagena]KAJ5620806.1 hypothetical protein N7510_004790 [Penicillium lagena]
MTEYSPLVPSIFGHHHLMMSLLSFIRRNRSKLHRFKSSFLELPSHNENNAYVQAGHDKIKTHDSGNENDANVQVGHDKIKTHDAGNENDAYVQVGNDKIKTHDSG